MNIYQHESYEVEAFIDLLRDTGMLSLEKDQKLHEFGTGMVNIICIDVKNPVVDSEGYSQQSKTFKLEFQADPTPIVTFNYEATPSGVVSEIISIYYTDGANNSDPENNEYFREFISDLNPVE